MRSQLGIPSISAKEKITCWDLKKFLKTKKIFLPGGIISTPLGTIATIIPSTMVHLNDDEYLIFNFEQSDKESKNLDKFNQILYEKTITDFGILVDISNKIKEKLDKSFTQEKKLDSTTLSLWAKVKGQKSPVSLPFKANLYVNRISVKIKKGKSKSFLLDKSMRSHFTEEWCINPFCHSHWAWWPGVGASTSCHGNAFCPAGTACKCKICTPQGPRWTGVCCGLKTCWCK